jgi:hypothetical protein
MRLGLALLLTRHVLPMTVPVDPQCDQGSAPRVVDSSQRLLIDFKCVQLACALPFASLMSPLRMSYVCVPQNI